MKPPRLLFKKSNNILFLSSYPPRECGIATFTQDLALAFNKKFNPVVGTKIAALNEKNCDNRKYEDNVIYEINAPELESYVSLAEKINLNNNIKLVNIQHEFGLFGGEYGNYLIPFLQALKKPVVTTFHSVLPRPNKLLKKVVKTISTQSEAVVVMNKFSQKILEKYYNIPHYKIAYIPHGIPQTAYEASKKHKKKLDLGEKLILSTFGLINKNKGIEYAIRALPKIIKKLPNTLYLIIGETHPAVKRRQGERYRNFLKREIDRLGLKNNIRFYNKYASLEEIVNFLRATDVYISPCIDRDQSVSGTLSYALGAGRPVVSTETEYAKYLLNKKNGILVPFKNSQEIATGVLEIVSSDKTIKSMATHAYKDTRPMIWPNVAESYLKLYKRFVDLEVERKKLPEIKLDHIIKMTDDFGIIQHARFAKPEKRFGYSLDDIARALIICGMHYKDNPSDKIRKLMEVYINFMRFAQRKDGSFVNIVSYQKNKDNTKEEDVQGRAGWALGYIVAQDFLPAEIREIAVACFKKLLPQLKKMESPRSIAFTMAGLYFYLKNSPQNLKIKRLLEKSADHLVELYNKNSSSDWRWFENSFTYSNSKLPEALLYAYGILKKRAYLKTALSSLDFLDSITFEGDYYSPIGQNGWYVKNKERSYFDQQPEDVATIVQTKILAYKITKKKKHFDDALKAFHWFLGKNCLGLMVYDELTGGCSDGLGRHSLNLNQGAESTISYTMARLSFEDPEIKNNLTSI